MRVGERQRPRRREPQGPDGTGNSSRLILAEHCGHQHERATTDGDLSICSGCGRIVGPISEAGARELLVLFIKWPDVDEITEAGGIDYAIRRVPSRPAPAPSPPSRNGHEKPARWGAVTV